MAATTDGVFTYVFRSLAESSRNGIERNSFLNWQNSTAVTIFTCQLEHPLFPLHPFRTRARTYTYVLLFSLLSSAPSSVLSLCLLYPWGISINVLIVVQASFYYGYLCLLVECMYVCMYVLRIHMYSLKILWYFCRQIAKLLWIFMFPRDRRLIHI